MNNFFRGTLTFFAAVYFFAGLYFALCMFPPDLVLDIFCHRVSQEELEELESDYGQMAGYLAGEGIPVAQSGEDYERLGGRREPEPSEELGRREYFTFETDSIIPLHLYQLKSNMDQDISIRRPGLRRNGKTRRDTYITSNFSNDRSYYNGYYLVKTPGGSYVPVWLEDACYWRYKLTGRVLLPIGYKTYMDNKVRAAVAPYVQQYGLDEEADEMLIMFSVERYERLHFLHFIIQLAVLVITMAIPVTAVWLVKKAHYKAIRAKEWD